MTREPGRLGDARRAAKSLRNAIDRALPALAAVQEDVIGEYVLLEGEEVDDEVLAFLQLAREQHPGEIMITVTGQQATDERIG